MRVIAVVNQKGGVGKTTATVNVGHALARGGYRVVLADLDPQGHLGPTLGHHGSGVCGIDRILLDGADPCSQLVPVRDHLSLIPAGRALAQFEYIDGGVDRAHRLRDGVQPLAGCCDFLLLDCAPATGMLVANAITAADDVLMPIAGDYLSLTGLARLTLTMRRMRALRHRPLREWVFLSRFTPRRRLSREVYAKVEAHFADKLLRTSIQEAAALAECAGAGKTIFEYRPSSRAAREFATLTDDLLQARVMANEQQGSSHVA